MITLDLWEAIVAATILISCGVMLGAAYQRDHDDDRRA